MSVTVKKTVFLRSYYFTPGEQTRQAFHSVLRSGHLTAGPEHHITRDSYPGHEIIYCLRGRGTARLGGSAFPVTAGQILWVNCHHPHAYWADPKAPWELYWLRFDGPQADRICNLLSAERAPVFTELDRRGVEACFTQIFSLMETQQPATPAWLHAEMARLLAYLFQARQSANPSGALEPGFPAALRKPVESMRLYFHRSWLVQELAAQAGMSPSHFYRVFKRLMGTSPNEWLRRERITQAKRRLIESDDPIKEIARQVGYGDQFFFSKDFKHVTGFTPTEYRQRERGIGPRQ